MEIIKTNLNFISPLTKRKKTSYIVLHHRAGSGDINSIHTAHQRLGWAGCGYHLYITKDGKVFSGRPIDTVGAQCTGYNEKSVGVCFEGDFEKEEMTSLQAKAGAKVIKYLKKEFASARVVRHKDLVATLCPGKNFPFEDIINEKEQKEQKLESANDITWELKQKIEIQDTDGFVKALDKAKKENSPLYWGYYKIVNK